MPGVSSVFFCDNVNMCAILQRMCSSSAPKRVPPASAFSPPTRAAAKARAQAHTFQARAAALFPPHLLVCSASTHARLVCGALPRHDAAHAGRAERLHVRHQSHPCAQVTARDEQAAERARPCLCTAAYFTVSASRLGWNEVLPLCIVLRQQVRMCGQKMSIL